MVAASSAARRGGSYAFPPFPACHDLSEYRIMVIPQLSKLMLGVRFPLLAVAMAGRQGRDKILNHIIKHKKSSSAEALARRMVSRL